MPEEKIIEYIKQNKKQGFSDEDIRKALLDAGWKKEDIEEGFRTVGEVKPQIKKAKPKWLIAVVVVVGVVVIGLIAWGGYFLFKPAPPEELPEEGLLEKEREEICIDKCGDGICQEVVCLAIGCPCAETVETCPEDCKEAVLEEEPIAEEIKDCGSVVNTHIFMYPQDMTDQERDSLKCINEALIDCNPSKIEFSGEGGGMYEIKGKENQNCLISQRIFEPESYKTCKIPIKFITDTKTAAEQQNQSDMLFVGVVLFPFSSGKATNVQTGEEIIFECE